MWVAGVDGCRGGWVMVWVEGAGAPLEPRWQRVATFGQVLERAQGAGAVAVDMPIGLLAAAEPGGRPCDRAARRLLGRPRRSSVFSPPVRPALAAADDYMRAQRLNRTSSPHKIGLSRQCHNLFPKLREVDAAFLAAPALQRRVREVHPEVSFQALAGRALVHPKRRVAGREERMAALQGAGFTGLGELVGAARGKGIAPDDALDACACCWTATRLARGRAVRLGGEKDAAGLRMEIWYY